MGGFVSRWCWGWPSRLRNWDYWEYDDSNRAQLIFDHDAGRGLVVVSPTHRADGSTTPALGIAVQGLLQSRPHPSTVNSVQVFKFDNEIGATFRFLNPDTPGTFQHSAPAITGSVHITKGANNTVSLSQNSATRFPSMRVIRDYPHVGGFQSNAILIRGQDGGTPLRLFMAEVEYQAQG